VPLNFNKLDIRDYLLHAYNVASVNVRSHIAQRPPRVSQFTKRVGRPPPIKYMTVELEKPFVFPREPDATEKEKWHSEEMQKRIKLEKEMEKNKVLFQLKGELSSPAKTRRSDDRVMLAEQARDLLSGKTKWDNKRTLDPRWTEQEKK
jgi:large subunit ribosomal protein L23